MDAIVLIVMQLTMANLGDFIQGDSETIIMPAFSNSLSILMDL